MNIFLSILSIRYPLDRCYVSDWEYDKSGVTSKTSRCIWNKNLSNFKKYIGFLFK